MHRTGHGQFENTQWSVVLAASGPDNDQAHRALEKLCESYWRPLYAFARRRGHSPHEAEDLTQGFFEQVLAKNSLATARADQGRFRSFLLTAFKHYAANDWSHRNRQKRGGGKLIFSIEEAAASGRADLEPPDYLTPDKAFDQRWARILVDRVLERLRTDYATSEKSQLFEELKPFLEDKKGQAYGEIAKKYEVSENAVAVAVSRLRKRYGDLLRAEVARTVKDPKDIQDELRQLISSLSS